MEKAAFWKKNYEPIGEGRPPPPPPLNPPLMCSKAVDPGGSRNPTIYCSGGRGRAPNYQSSPCCLLSCMLLFLSVELISWSSVFMFTVLFHSGFSLLVACGGL